MSGMSEEAFRREMASIEEKYQSSKISLEKQYAISNSEVKVGDVVEDHEGSVLVERISWSRLSSYGTMPMCIYIGTELTKKLQLRKIPRKRSVWQNNLKQVYKEEAGC